MEKTPSKLVPALIGGCVMGVLSTFPFISMGNCLCCMWILLGGGVGAYFYWRQLPPGSEFPVSEGAIVGLLSGVFGALFSTFLGYFFLAIGANPGSEIIQSILESRADLSPEFEDLLDEIHERGYVSPLFVFIGLLFSLVIDSIFGLIGGIIGAAIFRKRGQTNTPEATETS